MKTLSRYVLAGLLTFVIGILVYAYLAFPAAYVNRVLRWGDADVYDYRKFPERSLEASDSPFGFSRSTDQERVRTLFESIAGVDDMDAFLAKNRTQAFLVIQDDTILYEGDYGGASRDTIVTSFSIAKSFASALIGVTIAEGHIQSVDDPITGYLPELAERDPAFGKISIRDLLMMSSGIRYAEFPFVNGDDAKTYYYPDLRQLALEETQITGVAGERFHYNNYHPLLLGMILERATGRSVAEYLEQKIWQPMGTQYPGSWSLDEVGFEKMESGINGRAIDFAKFGRLFLHNGSWDGTQILPEAWVSESTQADRTLDYDNYYYDDYIFADGKGYYKYMWWGIQRDGQRYDLIAEGNHGQFMYIVPDKNLIILRFGES